jgi:hypothetical protein
MITMEIKSKTNSERGRGFWKLNTSLLKNKDFVNKINNTIDETVANHKELKNYGLLWDTVKMSIRGAAISYASHLAKTKTKQEKDLDVERDYLEKELANNPDDDLHKRYTSVKSEIEAINNERAEGIRIRAKCTHIELNEHSSKYFFCKVTRCSFQAQGEKGRPHAYKACC